MKNYLEDGLIIKNKEDKLKIFSNNALNIYSALVRIEDISSSQWLKSVPYLKSVKSLIEGLINKEFRENNYYLPRRTLQGYLY